LREIVIPTLIQGFPTLEKITLNALATGSRSLNTLAMTLAKFEDVIQQLQGNDPVQVYRALKIVKNSIIGNRTKKAQYANSGIIQRYIYFQGVAHVWHDWDCSLTKVNCYLYRLVQLLSPSNGVSEDLRMQAATILGSFAHGKR